MAKYEVTIKAILKRRVTIEAGSEEEAEAEAFAKIQEGKITLNFPDNLRFLDMTAKQK